MLGKSIFVLSLIGLIDSISFMAVAPSLVFYILQLGGTKEQYGLVMSTFSFANFCVKPIYGNWVDRHGNRYRAPYLASLIIAVVGALLYFFAASFSASPTAAIAMVFVGRLLSGLGAGNQALGYGYTASVVSQEMQTRTSTMLSMAKILGMTIGPAVNYFLGKVDSTFLGVPADPLNSVGLLLAALNLVAAIIVFFMLPEPPSSGDATKLKNAAGDLSSARPSFAQYWDLYLRIELLLPMFIIFAANSAFQLVETALPPAADHGLGWGPIETSGVLGATSVLIFIVMTLVMFLSSKKVTDTTLVAIGNILFIVGGICMYLFWTDNVTSVAQYVVPIIVAVSGFPFIASPNRSNFTRAVKSHSALESSQATMQAVLSMFPSLAGFLTPGFVAAFVVRSPEEVDAGGDHRELTPLALYAPGLCLLGLLGQLYSYCKENKLSDGDMMSSMGIPGEGTRLLSKKRESRRRSSIVELNQAMCPKTEVNRRSSVQIMGVPCFDTHEERVTRQSQLADLEELIALGELNFDDEEGGNTWN